MENNGKHWENHENLSFFSPRQALQNGEDPNSAIAAAKVQARWRDDHGPSKNFLDELDLFR